MKLKDWLGGRRIPGALALITVVYLAFAATLWLQPYRWSNTPSYGILLEIFPAYVWGTFYGVVAVLLSFTIYKPTLRPLAVTAHTVAIALTALWLVAFVIRYSTDPGTTIVNVASWSTYLALLIHSAFVLDDEYGKPLRIADLSEETKDS